MGHEIDLWLGYDTVLYENMAGASREPITEQIAMNMPNV
jgi:hypothetical protein